MEYVVDTNFVLNNPEKLKEYSIIITDVMLRELEDLERRKSDRQLQFQVRQAKHAIENATDCKWLTYIKDEYDEDDYSEDYADNKLLRIAAKNEYGLLTNDLLLRMKAKSAGVPLGNSNSNTAEAVENKGFKEVTMTGKQLKGIYIDLKTNHFDLIVNQYVVIYGAERNVIDIMKWSGEYLISLNNGSGMSNGFCSDQFSKFKPKDAYQKMAVDSITTNDVTMLRGPAGAGKSLIALETAWKLVEKDGYSLEIFTNPTPLSGAQELGLYKGDQRDKLLQTSVGNLLSSKFGNEYEVNRLLDNGKLKIIPFVELRGYDTGDKKIIWITEAQNLSRDLMKVALQRVSDGSKVIIDGDYYAQVDKDIYAKDSGMRAASSVLTGERLYGEIELQNIYRSKLADLADKM